MFSGFVMKSSLGNSIAYDKFAPPTAMAQSVLAPGAASKISKINLI